MPHIILCNRYWRVSGDELPISAVCAIIGRITALTIFSLLFSMTDEQDRGCHHNFTIYVCISITVFALSILVEGAIIYAGLQGTMVEMSKRRKELEIALSLHYVFAVFQLILGVWGIMLINDSLNILCTEDILKSGSTDAALLTIVAILQLIDVTSQFFCCFLLKAGRVNKNRFRGGSRSDSESALVPNIDLYSTDDESDFEDIENENQRVWERRCHSICNCSRFFSCGIFGGSSVAQDMEAVAKVLTSFFHHDGFLDVVPSDVMAGILLVRLSQRRSLQRYHSNQDEDVCDDDYTALRSGGSSVESSPDLESGLTDSKYNSPRKLSVTLPSRSKQTVSAPRRQLDPSKIDDSELIHELCRMSKFAFAIYSHLLYIYDRPITSACRLCYSCIGGNACMANRPVKGVSITSPVTDTPSGENCCVMNHAALTAVVNEMGSAEVVFASYHNDSLMKPYAIFLDHELEYVVISIRGSLSLEDCVTDVMCEPIELTSTGQKWGFDGKGRWAHGGFLRSAEVIREDIEREGILRALYAQVQVKTGSSHSYQSGHEVESNHVQPHPHYSLKIVGHSLGGGDAVLLSMMLSNQYAALKCCAFGTPGSLVDKVTAEDSKHWLTSVVLNNDIVARLGLSSMNHLREEILTSIIRAKVNKTQIMRTLVEEVDINEFLYPRGLEPESEFKNAVNDFLEHMRSKIEDLGKQHALVLPGRIITLSKVGRGEIHSNHTTCTGVLNALTCACKNACRTHKYIPEETTYEAFSEIIISPSMAVDHFPNRYVKELVALDSSWR
jgi:sn1-specific diacylglycerol lipase